MTDTPRTEAPLDVSEQLNARLAQLGQEHCLFTRHDRMFAVSVASTREVLIGEPATVVPQAPSPLVGVLNLRGEVVPLLQLDTLLDMPSRPYTTDDQILVLSANGVDIGLVVDRVREVRPISPQAIAAVPQGVVTHALFKGAWAGPHGLVTILDAPALVNSAVTVVSKGFRDRNLAREAERRRSGNASTRRT